MKSEILWYNVVNICIWRRKSSYRYSWYMICRIHCRGKEKCSFHIQKQSILYIYPDCLIKKCESYKLFWFLAIVDKVSDGKSYLTYDELINWMVADAWYMVTEFRLNLGPSDTLEALVKYI